MKSQSRLLLNYGNYEGLRLLTVVLGSQLITISLRTMLSRSPREHQLWAPASSLWLSLKLKGEEKDNTSLTHFTVLPNFLRNSPLTLFSFVIFSSKTLTLRAWSFWA